MTLHIGIIGASIAGLSCAIELQRLGLTVTIIEKSNGNVKQNGAGMMLPLDLVQTLLERHLIDQSFKGIVHSEFLTFVALPQQPQRFLTRTPIQGICVHWKDLYDTLRKKLDQPHCRYNYTVTKIIDQGNHVKLILNNGSDIKVDFLICADGYNSLGRKTVFPDIQPEFTHYIAWRGVIQFDNDALTQLHGKPYQNEYYRYLYEKGHLLIYPIPNIENHHQHLLNWVLYEKITPDHALFKNHPSLAKQNFVPGALPAEHITYLHELASYHLPEFPRNLIKQTNNPFVQAIFDVFVPHYVVGNICLIGDASILFRPHLGSNATKAIQDAIALSNVLAEELSKSNSNMHLALKRWDTNQQQRAKQLFPLSRALGKLLVTDVPDLATLTSERMDELWGQTVSNLSSG